jgi:hypothetical protein
VPLTERGCRFVAKEWGVELAARARLQRVALITPAICTKSPICPMTV